MTELIKKYEIKAKILLEVIDHPETKPNDVSKAMACRRFVIKFLNDLKQF